MTALYLGAVAIHFAWTRRRANRLGNEWDEQSPYPDFVPGLPQSTPMLPKFAGVR